LPRKALGRTGFGGHRYGRTAAAGTDDAGTPAYSETPLMNENRFAALLGQAALKVWSDLPRDAQERLFAAAVDDGVVANDLAEFLHDHHPRTAHPPKPTRFA
jgi:hypothetical protein